MRFERTWCSIWLLVLTAVKGLINFREIGHLWRVSRVEFTVAAVALVGVLLFGILKGVVVAAVASILLLSIMRRGLTSLSWAASGSRCPFTPGTRENSQQLTNKHLNPVKT